MRHIEVIVGLLVCVLLSGCKDDVASAGAGALTPDEEVRVYSGIFANIISKSDTIDGFQITQTPDSFLLGEVNTDVWATIKADLMTQFACPEGFEYPKSYDIDSIILMMTYSSWFADGNSPLRVSVYQMDLATFDYEATYSSHESIEKYISTKKVDGRVVVDEKTHAVEEDQNVVATHPKDSAYSSTEGKYYPIIRFKMNKAFVETMKTIKKFPSQKEFNKIFKGLYITTTWGASTALYVDNITMLIYYHYTRETTSGSVDTIKDTKFLYANDEVRQVNRYSFPNKEKVVNQLQAIKDTNFVISPDYVYTVLTLPIDQYVDTIFKKMARSDQGDTLQPYVNKALMRVDVLNVGKTKTSSDRWADPASDMLLIYKDSVNAFFSNNRLPSSDYCVLGSLTQEVNSDYSVSYHYDFDVSTLLYNELRRQKSTRSKVGDVSFVMIPVHVTYSSSSTTTTTVSQVKINQTITFTQLHSAQFESDPLNIDVVFSGFTINSLH